MSRRDIPNKSIAFFMTDTERDEYAAEFRDGGGHHVRTGTRTLSFMGESRTVYVVAYWPKGEAVITRRL